jgi:WhiB family redox-sensing transcriptional regulator
MSRPRRQLVAPPRWLADGACVGTDPEAFYPLDEDGSGAEPARRVCAGCPLRRRCLDYAISTGQPAGIWGGRSTNERTQVMFDQSVWARSGRRR